MKAKCKHCGDTVEVTRPREFKSCECGAIALDYGDGEYYFRVCGSPEDFDGEIEGAPKIHTGDIVVEHFHPEQTETTVRYNKPADESMGKAAEICEYLSKAIKVKESYMGVDVVLCENGMLYINDEETDEQLAVFEVVEED